MSTDIINKTILFLDAYFEPESTPYSYLEKGIIDGLIERGNRIEILCPTPSRGLSKSTIDENRNKRDFYIYEGKVHVKRFYAPNENHNILMRALRYLICNIKTYFMGINYKNVDAVFCASTPPTQGFIAGKIAKKLSKKNKKVPFIYNIQDVFPDSLVSLGLTKKSSFLWYIGRHIEKVTYKNADGLVVISESFKNNLMEKGVAPEKIWVVPNWADIENIVKIDRKDNSLFDKYNLNRDFFYVLYCGNIGHSQNFDLLLNVAKVLNKRNSEVRFVLVGDGDDRERLVKRVELEKLTNVIFIPFQPYEKISEVFSLGDCGLIISKPGVGKNSIPSKTWGYMAVGSPLIVSFDPDSELSLLIESIHCGAVVSQSDPLCFANEIVNIDISFGKNGYDYVHSKLSKKEQVAQYCGVIEGV